MQGLSETERLADALRSAREVLRLIANVGAPPIAAEASRAMAKIDAVTPRPPAPGTYQCHACDGLGVIDQCVVCGENVAHGGRCGSPDPRALCNWKPS